jgi:alpha-methylacyl-CoA racemase
MSGPLAGIRVVELAGLGPAPFCGMVLADMGAEVVKVGRADAKPQPVGGSGSHDVLNRGKKAIEIDLKQPDGVDIVLRMVAGSDALIEGFRPGVTERLGLGPDRCLERNPALVYGRMTGWGQEGPLSGDPGHDIDYIAVSGVLGAIGPKEDPVVPLNLVGDFGGGGMLLALGIVAGILNARFSGEGQVVDAAMVDGSALLMAQVHGFVGEGWWSPLRQSNLLDGSAPFYTTYRTSDGGHMAVGALEPRFFEELLDILGLDATQVPGQQDRDRWPEMRAALAAVFATRTRDEWSEVFAGTDACVAPVLDLVEAASHRHNAARSTFIEVGGVVQPAPAPRFSRTPATAGSPPAPGADTDAILASLGYTAPEISMLRSAGTVV